MADREPMAILRDQLAARNEQQERKRSVAGRPVPADGAQVSLVLTLDAPAARGLEALAASLGVPPTRLAEQLLQDAIVNRYGAPG